jgi:hypothetical protein
MSDDAAPSRALFPARLVIGLLQGLILYGLYRAADGHSWLASDPYIFAPLVLIFLYVPLLVSQAAGGMRLATLIGWAVVATAACAGLAFYDRFRAGIIVITAPDNLIPEFPTFFFGFAALFIAQSLIAAGDHERRVVASYDGYFDDAWKLGVQLALAAVFVGVFWGVLWLGAMLFDLIQLKFLENLIQHDWFAIPATTLATAAALHLTDVRARLVAGIRNVVLTMLAWLLPLLTIIAVGFLLTLLFTGLQVLWQTRDAATGLLVASATLVVLINAAYQNGEDARPIALRYSEAIASLALIPLVALAIYAVALRVNQYGLTVDRIASIACLVIATCYALGYAASAALSLRGGEWMQSVQRVNVFAAFAVIAVVLALFSPVADPARLSVNSQVARLQAGKVTAQKFDFDYLRSEGGRYGDAALKQLAQSGNADIRKAAQFQIDVQKPSPPPPKNYDMALNVTVYPKGASLPPGFLKQNWASVRSGLGAPVCFITPGYKCDAILVDLDQGGTPAVIVVTGSEDDRTWWGTAIEKQPDGMWIPVGFIPSPHCAGDLEALRNGKYRIATPPGHVVEIGGHVMPIKMNDPAEPDCKP